ncbi:MAG: hypothetical protein OEY14_06630 [Myxococcales bacterium]|nr:hypothetical protein [Myxococcales bacterium]
MPDIDDRVPALVWTYEPPDSSWRLEREEGVRFYRLPDGVIVIVPPDRDIEDGVRAARSRELMLGMAAADGRPLRVAVLMDQLAGQEPAARKVWAEQISTDWYERCALISSSLMARAIVSFFNGLRRPPVPTKVFSTIEEGLLWLREGERSGHSESRP